MGRNNALDDLAGNGYEILYSRWAYTCEETFVKKLKKLKEEHPGKYVAIDGENIIDINNLSHIESEYLQNGKTHIRIFYIPQKDEEGISLDLLLPSNPIFE